MLVSLDSGTLEYVPIHYNVFWGQCSLVRVLEAPRVPCNKTVATFSLISTHTLEIDSKLPLGSLFLKDICAITFLWNWSVALLPALVLTRVSKEPVLAFSPKQSPRIVFKRYSLHPQMVFIPFFKRGMLRYPVQLLYGSDPGLPARSSALKHAWNNSASPSIPTKYWMADQVDPQLFIPNTLLVKHHTRQRPYRHQSSSIGFFTHIHSKVSTKESRSSFEDSLLLIPQIEMLIPTMWRASTSASRGQRSRPWAFDSWFSLSRNDLIVVSSQQHLVLYGPMWVPSRTLVDLGFLSVPVERWSSRWATVCHFSSDTHADSPSFLRPQHSPADALLQGDLPVARMRKSPSLSEVTNKADPGPSVQIDFKFQYTGALPYSNSIFPGAYQRGKSWINCPRDFPVRNYRERIFLLPRRRNVAI